LETNLEAMDGRDAWLSKLLGATELALERTHVTDPYLYLELLEVYAQLQRQAARADADAELSRTGRRRGAIAGGTSPRRSP